MAIGMETNKKKQSFTQFKKRDMGLDMYLSRKKYVKNWSHTPADKRFQGVAFKGNQAIDLSKLSYLEFEAMYWRKVNAIHNWFVENVQNGADDCGTYYVTHDQIEQLILTIERVLEKKDDEEAQALLPPSEGFFFGSTEKDDYYWDMLTETRWKLKEDYEANPNDEYYYHASW